MNAVVLLSGGLDSSTVLAMAKERGFTPHALSFSYRQRHQSELGCAKLIAEAAGVDHKIVNINLRAFGGSALTDDAIDVPTDRDEATMGADIPVTYVPARNTVFLSFALAYAETLGAFDIFAGVNAMDYSGYPDCRPEFIAAFEAMCNLATKAGVEGGKYTIHTPIIEMTKQQIIAEGLRLGVPYQHTSSCYQPDEHGRACGVCDSCILRQKGFAANGVVDPIEYVPQESR